MLFYCLILHKLTFTLFLLCTRVISNELMHTTCIINKNFQHLRVKEKKGSLSLTNLNCSLLYRIHINVCGKTRNSRIAEHGW